MAKGQWRDWLRNYLAVPESLSRDEFRSYNLALYACPAAGVFHFSWIFLFWALGVVPLAILNILSTAAWMAAAWLNFRRRIVAALLVAQAEITVHAWFACSELGLSAGYQYYLLPSAAVFFLSHVAIRYRLMDTAANAVLFIIMYITFGTDAGSYGVATTAHVSPDTIRALGISNILSVFFITILPVYYYARAVEIAEAALDRAHERSESLLRNILPAAIAERLKENPEVIAERYESASVLFADIVNFTPFSERQTPEHIVATLNAVFSDIDELVEKHGLEKIKTIGDAYLVVSGAPNTREDHARALANFALELLDRIERTPDYDVSTEASWRLQLRIGMHSGPLVAGVIGKKKFAYDVWGDTVNTAARMESSGVPGRIHLTQAMAEKLDDNYLCEERGEIELKGKGTIKTFFLNAP